MRAVHVCSVCGIYLALCPAGTSGLRFPQEEILCLRRVLNSACNVCGGPRVAARRSMSARTLHVLWRCSAQKYSYHTVQEQRFVMRAGVIRRCHRAPCRVVAKRAQNAYARASPRVRPRLPNVQVVEQPLGMAVGEYGMRAEAGVKSRRE